jgi:ribosome-binding factor A
MSKRIKRVNSLIKRVVSEIICEKVRNPNISKFTTITRVDTSKDLYKAKVYVSVMGTKNERESTLFALKSASGFISINASKKVIMRIFPSLVFYLDTSVDDQMKIDSLLKKICEKK